MKNTKIAGQYRQGDVLIQRANVLPRSVTPNHEFENGRIILAHGEATGHHHSIDMNDADWWKAENEGGDQIVDVKLPTQLTHQEHEPINLKSGMHLVRRQREYSPEAIGNVAD